MDFDNVIHELLMVCVAMAWCFVLEDWGGWERAAGQGPGVQ